jgi:tetratricopeptide (TPR) repeat protein
MNKLPDFNPLNFLVFLSRAKASLQRKQFDQALADLDEALRLNPESGDALMVRATVRAEMGDYRQALADVERRLQIEPPDPAVLLTRANLRACLGERESAVQDFTDFLREQPETVIGLRARAFNYTCLHRFEEALVDLNEAVRLEPANAEAWLDRGRLYQKTASYDAALADYQKALDLGPTDPGIYNQYAWMLAACPESKYRDGTRAVELARRGCELTDWQDANILDTLACAYAECSRFEEAGTWASKSLEMADDDIKGAVAGHVELFRNGKPARFEDCPA